MMILCGDLAKYGVTITPEVPCVSGYDYAGRE
jgi:hypothetical protein